MLFSDSLNDDLSEDDLEVEAERLAMGTATVPQDEDTERPSTSGETQLNENHQPGTSATPDRGQSRSARKRQPMKRKANFEVDKVMHSFQKMQEATLKAFTDAEKERVAQQLAVEERREKREEKREKRMLQFFAQMFGANNVPNDNDSDSSSDESISHVLGSTSRVLYP